MSDFTDFVDDYYRRFVEVLQTFDRAPMRGVLEVLERVQASGGTIWVAGNGGSAAIADHTVCDATKGTYVDGQPPLRTVSLSSNVAMLTALSNDFCYTDASMTQALIVLAGSIAAST
jgi:D-sedoheptulose 7-phosphate isomerase